jgi:putative peptidoglycan lipid II flippase
MLLRQPIVALLYQRGQFGALMTTMVSWALFWYAAGLVGHSMLEILTRAFYAQHDTRTPVMVGVGAMSLNVILSFAFSDLFARLGWMPLGGLALANSTATALEMGTLFLIMRRRLNGLQGTSLSRGFLQAAAGTLAMSLVLVLWLQRRGSGLLIGLGGVALGSAVYVLMMWALRVPELQTIYQVLKRRLGFAQGGV